jgi:hypothetical protein
MRKAVGLFQLLIFLKRNDFLDPELIESFYRIGFIDLVFEGIHPRKINDGGHGAFNVESIAMPTFGFNDKIAKKPEGRFEIEGIFGHVPEKSGPSVKRCEQMPSQFGNQDLLQTRVGNRRRYWPEADPRLRQHESNR